MVIFCVKYKNNCVFYVWVLKVLVGKLYSLISRLLLMVKYEVGNVIVKIRDLSSMFYRVCIGYLKY